MLALKLDRENETRDTIAIFPRYIFMRYNLIHPKLDAFSYAYSLYLYICISYGGTCYASP